MSLVLANEIWAELKRFIGSVDREEAAEIMVNVMIDSDHSPEEIKAAFKSDADIKRVLVPYFEDELEVIDDEDEEYNDYDDDEDDKDY
jgi:hypothetical protein